MKAINAKGLGKTYENGVVGLKALDLEVPKGSIFGFLGPNGAGKTTTVRLLNGTLTPSHGESAVLGISSRDEEIRKRTG
ncbi:MAG: ATP-binding cassette domain-containing protein, partial [Spirochaetia bacterium]